MGVNDGNIYILGNDWLCDLSLCFFYSKTKQKELGLSWGISLFSMDAHHHRNIGTWDERGPGVSHREASQQLGGSSSSWGYP